MLTVFQRDNLFYKYYSSSAVRGLSYMDAATHCVSEGGQLAQTDGSRASIDVFGTWLNEIGGVDSSLVWLNYSNVTQAILAESSNYSLYFDKLFSLDISLR